jgi:hypothetical protein
MLHQVKIVQQNCLQRTTTLTRPNDIRKGFYLSGEYEFDDQFGALACARDCGLILIQYKNLYAKPAVQNASCFVRIQDILYVYQCLVWGPGQNKRIAPLPFVHECRERRLKN